MTIVRKILKWTALTVSAAAPFLALLAINYHNLYYWDPEDPKRIDNAILQSEILSEPGWPLVRGIFMEVQYASFRDPIPDLDQIARKIARWAVRHDSEDPGILQIAVRFNGFAPYDLWEETPHMTLTFSGANLRRINVDLMNVEGIINIAKVTIHDPVVLETIREFCSDRRKDFVYLYFCLAAQQ